MTAPTNTTATTNSVGNREDLEDIIYRVAPEKTPFISAIGTTKATAILHEWQTETLANANASNAQLEGDDVGTLDAPNLTSRLGNYMQIFRKTGGVSRTQDIVKSAGRANDTARQKTLKGIEMRRDQEKRFMGNYASNAESGATPRGTAGALAFAVSNVSRGSGGSSGGYTAGVVAAATNGTQRSLTEALLKSVMATAFGNGAELSQIFLAGPHKQQFSAFTGIAETRKEVKSNNMATIVGAADVYVSDFGELAAIPHAYGLTRDSLLIDPDMVAVATLDGVKSQPLARTGDSDRFMITAEKGLEVKNEKGIAVIADLL